MRLGTPEAAVKEARIMRVQDVMTTNVRTVSPVESAEAAWNQMSLYGIHHLVVMDGSDVAGVLSARDLGGDRGESLRKGKNVSELMNDGVLSAKPETTLRQAANLMRGRAIGSLPVLEDGKLKGIVTVSDLLELIGRGTDKPMAHGDRPMLTRKHKGGPGRKN
jgi:CBS domain-containing protein